MQKSSNKEKKQDHGINITTELTRTKSNERRQCSVFKEQRDWVRWQ